MDFNPRSRPSRRVSPSRPGERRMDRRTILPWAVVLSAAVSALILVRFLPNSKTFGSLDLDARSALLMDSDTGEVLAAKNPTASIYPASTTKILTALIALENADPNESVTVGQEIWLAPGDSSKAGLRIGDRIRMKDLVWGLMLPSGGDAAFAIAVHIARSAGPSKSLSIREAVSRFVALMNERAERAGARRSWFSTPDGYDESHQTTTVYDLALIARAAMALPLFREIVGSENHSRIAAAVERRIAGRRTNDGGLRLWENRNKLLDDLSPYYYHGANGIKTGHTAEAGYCLVSSARRTGRNLISVVMNSTDTGVWTDSIVLLNYGFGSPIRPIPEARAVFNLRWTLESPSQN